MADKKLEELHSHFIDFLNKLKVMGFDATEIVRSLQTTVIGYFTANSMSRKDYMEFCANIWDTLVKK